MWKKKTPGTTDQPTTITDEENDRDLSAIAYYEVRDRIMLKDVTEATCLKLIAHESTGMLNEVKGLRRDVQEAQEALGSLISAVFFGFFGVIILLGVMIYLRFFAHLPA